MVYPLKISVKIMRSTNSTKDRIGISSMTWNVLTNNRNFTNTFFNAINNNDSSLPIIRNKFLSRRTRNGIIVQTIESS